MFKKFKKSAAALICFLLAISAVMPAYAKGNAKQISDSIYRNGSYLFAESSRYFSCCADDNVRRHITLRLSSQIDNFYR